MSKFFFKCLAIFVYLIIPTHLAWGDNTSVIDLIHDDDKKEFIISARVIGGYACSIASHPYMVSIRYTVNNTHKCGGTLLSSVWILTAAHCAIPNYVSGTFTAFAGISALTRVTLFSTKMQSAVVLKNFMHMNYSIKAPFDIALMLLADPIQKTKYVHYVHLAKYLDTMGKDFYEICNDTIAVGWGVEYSIYNRRISRMHIKKHDPTLHCLDLTVITNEECSVLTGYFVEDTRICTFAKQGETCQEDSGGPLICHGIQYGIVSSGIICGRKNVPGVYIRVDMFEDFISKTIRRNSGFARLCKDIRAHYFLWTTLVWIYYHLQSIKLLL